MKFTQVVESVCEQLLAGGWSKKDLRSLAKSEVLAELAGRLVEGYNFEELDAWQLIAECAISPPDVDPWEGKAVIVKNTRHDGMLYYCGIGLGKRAWTNNRKDAKEFDTAEFAQDEIDAMKIHGGDVLPAATT